MKLYIKERIFSWEDSFNIMDEKGDTVYRCIGEETILGNRFEISKGKTAVAEIHEKLIKLRPKYTVKIDNEEFEVVKKVIGFRDSFRVHDLDWDITGNILGHEYEIKKNREKVAKISKKLFRAVNTYEIDIPNGKNALQVLSCAIVIDAVMAEEEKEKAEKGAKKK